MMAGRYATTFSRGDSSCHLLSTSCSSNRSGEVIRSQKLSIGPEVVNLGSSLEILKGDGLRCNSSVFVI
jgi:hypothetical protein